MAVDIVEQLRCHFADCDGTCVTVVAADEIVRLRAEVERLTAENAELQDGQVLNRWPLHKMVAAERALADQLGDL